MAKWILASASPRRKELLTELLPEFETIASTADEKTEKPLSPKALVKLLATRKAQEVAERPENEGVCVIGADTVVAFGKEILGKPKDEADAFRMLTMLSGEKHAVYTGVCVCVHRNGKTVCKAQTAKTSVYFNGLSEEWIRAYIAGGSPMDKAGAYGIQDGGLAARIRGSYSNVIGLPLELCERMIQPFMHE